MHQTTLCRSFGLQNRIERQFVSQVRVYALFEHVILGYQPDES